METFRVRKWPEQGSTLYSIAEMFYGDGGKWTHIYETNKGRLSDVVLRTGQEVILKPIPEYEEMMVLYEEA